MNDRNVILVLGSKPSATLPAIKPDHIYAANSAVLIAKKYINHESQKGDITCVTTGKQLQKRNVKEAILNANPGYIVSRRWAIPEEIRKNLKDTNITSLSNRDQERFQKESMGYGRYISEFCIIPGMWKKNKKSALKRIYALLFLKFSGGLSTGLYSVLLAAKNHPHHKIYVAGISLDSGVHFDDNNHEFPLWRGLLDRQMVRYFPPDIKKRIITTDESFSQWAAVDFYREKYDIS